MTRPSVRKRRPKGDPLSFKDLQIVEIDISTIKIDPNNPRRHSEAQLALLEKIVRRFGYLAPLLVHVLDLRLIAGHGRLEIAKRLGLTKVHVVLIGPLSPAEIETLKLGDNRIAELATWDEDMLKVSFEVILGDETLDFSADLTGFEPAKIDALVFGSAFAEESDPADEILPAPVAAPITQLGDVWRAGDVTLVCADALDGEAWRAALGGRKADLVLTDAPYNQRPRQISKSGKHGAFVQGSGELSSAQFVDFLTHALERAKANARPGAFIYAFMDSAHLLDLQLAGRAVGLEQVTICTWAKTQAGMGSLYRQQTEHIVIFKVAGDKHTNNIQLGRNGRNRSTLWTYPGMNTFGRDRTAALKLHPTVKPVGLLRDAILDVTQRGDLVVDPFAGVGSTLIAAARCGRASAGIELDPRYVDAALTRLTAVLGLDFVRASDGAHWCDLAALASQEARS